MDESVVELPDGSFSWSLGILLPSGSLLRFGQVNGRLPRAHYIGRPRVKRKEANGQMKRPSAPFLLSYGAVTLTDESSDLLLVGHKLAVER